VVVVQQGAAGFITQMMCWCQSLHCAMVSDLLWAKAAVFTPVTP
jgi:hypothetical protein